MMRCLTVFVIFLLVCAVLLGVTIFLFIQLFPVEEEVLASLPDFDRKEYYISDGFQDYTIYAKYTYTGVTGAMLEENTYFSAVTSGDLEEILLYLEDFEGWVSIVDSFPAESYDFDRSVLSAGDYFCICSKYTESDDQRFWDYDVYYFDLDAQTLYYFHNNI